MGRFGIVSRLPEGDCGERLRADVLSGLTSRPKSLPPKWFYDAEGSRLFERITRSPEYYLSRAEREILAERAPLIAATGARSLIELGSGSSAKTRVLIDALRPERYVPVDVSRAALEGAAAALSAAYPGLEIRAVVDDFQRELHLPRSPAPRLLAFLGGTVGNLLPVRRARFLAGLRRLLEPGDALLLGTDLVKDEAALVAAYDDAAGVTAAFNRHVLEVLNRRLGADFDPGDFAHVVRWDAGREWIEMRLRARRALGVAVAALGIEFHFAAGEDLLTEVSAKFRREGVTAELTRAGFAPRHWWTDGEGRYALTLATVSDGSYSL
ncbi:L-histidine N(alpha)-methyltransferase [Glycomyces arizonensis]|uniref:L-histidine N(alpha)-methyltransferase n=1 Tax=Glycomyces arizonensis TaxID=256035 RepID=UPI000416910F|nr:L-histidine N(alpha)-methyltransferase [Glycomyces arizonensis]